MKDNNIPEPTKKPIYNTRKPKLKGKEKQIKELIEKEFNINEICKILNVSKITLKNFMKNNGIA
jgi:DNA invertase Pin-like site-specific DNA recombinase